MNGDHRQAGEARPAVISRQPCPSPPESSTVSERARSVSAGGRVNRRVAARSRSGPVAREGGMAAGPDRPCRHAPPAGGWTRPRARHAGQRREAPAGAARCRYGPVYWLVGVVRLPKTADEQKTPFPRATAGSPTTSMAPHDGAPRGPEIQARAPHRLPCRAKKPPNGPRWAGQDLGAIDHPAQWEALGAGPV